MGSDSRLEAFTATVSGVCSLTIDGEMIPMDDERAMSLGWRSKSILLHTCV